MSRKEKSREYYLKNKEKILEKVRAYREKNRTKIRAKNRKKYANDEEHREKAKEYQVIYRKENREKVYKYQRKYRNTKLKDWHNEWKRKWVKTPKGKIASQLKGYRRRSLLKESIGKHTPEEWTELCKKYKNKCRHCGKKEKLTKDHIIPLSKGGTNTIDNIQPLCAKCNSKKGNQYPQE